MTPQVCFINTEDAPLSTRHIGWKVERNGDDLILIEIVEEKYPHPEAPENAIVWLKNMHVKVRFKQHEKKAAALIVMLAAQDVCTEIFGKSLGQ